MMDATKYAPGYYPVPAGYDSWVKKDHIEKAPAWCSVDLRDGNQALIVPMSLEEKLEFFQMLVKIGFKEIEVGFPAASETEYEFLRTLIEKNMIPEDVTVQVLTQCRDHIIRKTFEAVKGAPRAVIHFYNSTSVAQREQVFHKSREEIKKIATDGAKLVKQLSQEYEGNFLFEYSPESFTGTEVDYAVEVCNAVLDIMQPTPDRPMIINLPVTVEMSMPHVYANQIEYCDKHLKYRDSVIISTHPHNDRGTGVACAEMAVLAGAQRVECCLFGNGERTGNVDAVTLAMNLYSHGVDPRLDFSDMPAICAAYERVTRMHIYERTPYAGQLVFAAFSGSHQDAIAKGMAFTVPGTYCLGDGTNAAGTLTRWVRDLLYSKELDAEKQGGENAYAVMAREAAAVPPGSDGLMMLPYIYGERSPLQDAEATGMLFGLKGTHGRAQINRAALEAVGYSTYQHLLLFEELGVPPRRIITAGGGTKNAAWMQIICDMAGMPLTIPEPFQCSSYGDAMLAALGVGALESFAALRAALPQGRILQPNRKNHEFYQEHYPIFRDLYLENRDRMHRMQK